MAKGAAVNSSERGNESSWYIKDRKIAGQLSD
jgi:hypothetical protein